MISNLPGSAMMVILLLRDACYCYKMVLEVSHIYLTIFIFCFLLFSITWDLSGNFAYCWTMCSGFWRWLSYKVWLLLAYLCGLILLDFAGRLLFVVKECYYKRWYTVTKVKLWVKIKHDNYLYSMRQVICLKLLRIM